MADEHVLSTEAIRLMRILLDERSRAAGFEEPPRHIPDHELSELCSLPIRDLIDAAGELIAKAKLLVLADSRGRWIGDPHEAVRYYKSLTGRAKAIMVRRRDLRNALRARGQLHLLFPPTVPPGAMSIAEHRRLCDNAAAQEPR